MQQLSLIIIANKRCRLLAIYFQAHLNRIAAVIAPLHERFSTSITDPIHLGRRKVYMERVRQVASTGIDGIYVDIPYWMTHFDGWEQSWSSFDDYTLAAFKAKTGLNAKRDIRIGDFNDPNFIQWVDFRIAALTDFMKEIDSNVKAVNSQCMTIADLPWN